MMMSLILAGLAVVLLTAALVLRRRGSARTPLPRRAAIGVVGVVAVLGVAYVAVAIFAPSWLAVRPEGNAQGRPTLPEGDYPAEVLAVGAAMPKLEAEGWIHGPPADVADAKLTVIDIWASWCPYCRATAPGLVQLEAKFRERGVRFISLSTMPEIPVQTFVDAHAVPWPSAFGVSLATVAHFGAYNRESTIPGYEVAPTLYIVGADGRIAWCDQQARYRHEDPEVLVPRLESAIADLLARSPG